MEIQVLTRSKHKDAIEKSAKFYAKKLNVFKSNYKVLIYTDSTLKENGANGLAMRMLPDECHIALYSRLPFGQLLRTLAHEMVHVKQYIRGHYRTELSRNGKVKRFWLGTQVTAKYEKQPWEIEAYKKQDILVCDLIETLARKIKKAKSHT
jgi:hypothetical protein